MPDILRKIPFSEALLESVSGFDCGSDPWEAPLSQWITAAPDVENSALFELRQKVDLQVWLHINQANELVGYSSLGQSRWRWPLATSPRVPVSIIPNVAIQKRFQGQPPDGPRYSTQIMDHLVYEAGRHAHQAPLLVLYVDPRNIAAAKFYQKYGFESFSQTYADQASGITYSSMILKLAE